ncbi:MAG TPA: universal stress protein [Hanamia sp.]|nr:universal stress protein [Hanamia sp.]
MIIRDVTDRGYFATKLKPGKMKKFLAVFDGFKMSTSTLQYAIELSKLEEAHLVGVFLDEFMYHTYSVYKVMTSEKNPEKELQQLDEKDRKLRDESVLQFEKACAKAGIHYSIHRDRNIALQELKEESMFADLAIISENETFTRYKEKLPSRFMKDFLSDVQCPVFVVPGSYKEIDKILLLYDGGPSSLHAIKMFSYLLGRLKSLPVEVYTVKENYMATLRLPGNKRMREFIKWHFPKAAITVEKGIAEEQIPGYLRNHKENELVILGAYRRSELSRWFKISMADILIKETDTPLFIAHNK